jgi:DNA-binding FadR family transcriptional regulator
VWGQSSPLLGRANLATFQREHAQILSAIRARGVPQARSTMQRHLSNSQRRYQKLAAELGVK